MIGVFLDASCWVAAAGSPAGGSSRILELGKQGKIRILATPTILKEAEKNIAEAFGDEALLRFYERLRSVNVERTEDPSEDRLSQWDHIVPTKDRHVLAGAIASKCDVLVSLDRKHILTERVRSALSIKVYDTKEFLLFMLESIAIKEPVEGASEFIDGEDQR